MLRRPLDGKDLPLYRPVDFLIDHTVLREPVLWWAELWGVRDEFETMSRLREVKRDALEYSY
jgi:hypothetical protein